MGVLFSVLYFFMYCILCGCFIFTVEVRYTCDACRHGNHIRTGNRTSIFVTLPKIPILFQLPLVKLMTETQYCTTYTICPAENIYLYIYSLESSVTMSVSRRISTHCTQQYDSCEANIDIFFSHWCCSRSPVFHFD